MNEIIPPMAFRYTDDEVMVPLHRTRAARHFVIGERYILAPFEERSMASHNHEFAWLADAWANLPEDVADQFPTPDHLRKRALIQAGYYHETIVDAGSNAAALRVAVGFRAQDEFAYVVVRGPMVAVRTAKSQSRRAMGAKEFQDSKQSILDVVAGMIGVTADQLVQEAGRAA